MDLTTLGIRVTTDGVQQAASQLDKLADAGDKAAASAEKMAPAIKKSGNALKEYPARQYQRDLEKLISSYDRTEDKLSALAKQQEKWNQLHKSGSIDTRALDAYTTRLDKVRNQMGLMAQANNKAAISSAQLQAANRNLPAQFTDIAVSLQAGQNPMTVFLQQGGQLKDMYGGVGPALKAMSSYILGLVNPLTLAAAASAALFVAWRNGVNDFADFNRALIASGDSAKLAGESFTAMVAQLDAIEGVSRGGAAEALTAVASAGKFTADQFQLVAASAARMRAATGVELDATIKKFADLKKDPYNALIALTEAEGFLTREQLERVKVLQDEGREQDAATEAIRIYSENLDDVSRRSREVMPAMSRYWQELKEDISGAWGSLSDFLTLLDRAAGRAGRDSGISGLAGELKDLASSLTGRNGLTSAVGTFGMSWLRAYAGDQTATTGTRRGLPRSPSRRTDDFVDPVALRAEEEERKRTKALEEWASTADRAAQRQQTLNKLRDEGRKLGASEAEIEAVLNRQRAEWAAQDAKSAGSSRRRREEKTEEQKATEALIKAYESLNTQMDRRLFIMSNGNDEAAALAYDFERGALSKMNDELARTLTYLDAMGQTRNFESVADMRERMTNSVRAIEAEEDFNAIYGGFDKITDKAEESKDAMTAFADQAARNMQSSFADFLFNPFDDGISGMVKGFSDSLRRMAAELAASKVFEMLSSWATGYSGKGANLINAIGGAMKGGKGYAEGGYTGAGGVYDPAGIVHKGEVVWSQRDVSRAGGVGVVEAMRLGLRGYASGGVVGGPSGRIVGGNQPSVAVNIQNNTGSQMDTSEQSVNFDGEKWVVNIVAKAIGSGRLDRTMGSAFGVRRQGYSGG